MLGLRLGVRVRLRTEAVAYGQYMIGSVKYPLNSSELLQDPLFHGLDNCSSPILRFVLSHVDGSCSMQITFALRVVRWIPHSYASTTSEDAAIPLGLDNKEGQGRSTPRRGVNVYPRRRARKSFPCTVGLQ